MRVTQVYSDIAAERAAQPFVRDFPDGTGTGALDVERAAMAQRVRQYAEQSAGQPAWRYVLDEAVAAALAESDPAALRARLVSAAATCVEWIEALDRRADRD